jgi:hypothetical protein
MHEHHGGASDQDLPELPRAVVLAVRVARALLAARAVGHLP